MKNIHYNIYILRLKCNKRAIQARLLQRFIFKNKQLALFSCNGTVTNISTILHAFKTNLTTYFNGIHLRF